jgi:hypothetical protein
MRLSRSLGLQSRSKSLTHGGAVVGDGDDGVGTPSGLTGVPARQPRRAGDERGSAAAGTT